MVCGELRATNCGQLEPAGLTLLELLLVIALLTILTSLAMPLLEESFESMRIRQGTDQVIAIWSRARTAAIESGQVHFFRYQAETGNYRVEPLADETDSSDRTQWEKNRTEVPSSKSSAAPQLLMDAQFDENGSARIEGTLPGSIVIRTGASLVEELADSAIGGEADVEERAHSLDGRSEREWSSPIMFYPDGTSGDASLLVESRQRKQRVTLRGLTGIARTGTVN